MRMIQSGGDFVLLFKTLEKNGVFGGRWRQYLDGDNLAGDPMPGFIHRPHTAFGDLGENGVVANLVRGYGAGVGRHPSLSCPDWVRRGLHVQIRRTKPESDSGLLRQRHWLGYDCPTNFTRLRRKISHGLLLGRTNRESCPTVKSGESDTWSAYGRGVKV